MKPWYKIVTPRKDLREGKALDASEFAVHLDQVREGKAPPDCRNHDRFFARGWLTALLDRIHQSMILFGAGRGEALKRFLIEQGAGGHQRFWRLTQAASALHPRKKGLGF